MTKKSRTPESVSPTLSPEGNISFDDAVTLAQKHAKAAPEDYYEEPFKPHLWVINAIVEASSTWYSRAVGERVRRVKAEAAVSQRAANTDYDEPTREMMEEQRVLFERDARALGFDLTRSEAEADLIEPWVHYLDNGTGNRWGGWLAAAFSTHERPKAPPGTCKRPPAGFYCSKEANHQGPCPTYEE